MRWLYWCHTWVGLQQDLSLSVDLLSPVFGAVCAAHQVLKVSVQLSLLRLAQLLLCELRQSTQTVTGEPMKHVPICPALVSELFYTAGESTRRRDVMKGPVRYLVFTTWNSLYRPLYPDTHKRGHMNNSTYVYYNLLSYFSWSMLNLY